MKIAVVTGASSGMGREFVKQIGHLYRSLDEIWVFARRKERLLSLQTETSVPLRIFEGDLLKPPVYAAFKQALAQKQPDIRMLVNAAGFGKTGSVEEILKEDKNTQLEMIDLNCIALSRMTFFCMPYLSKGSRVLNLASAAAFCPQPLFTVYAATKSYVMSFTRALGEELRPRGILVTAVCPGPVDTEFFEVSGKIENIWKKIVLAKAPDVVRRALLDSRAGKRVSVYGIAIKGARAASKLIPHYLILKLEAKGNQKGGR